MFARVADDYADEGTDSPEFKLKKLEEHEDKLTRCLNGQYESNIWLALHQTIIDNNLSSVNFYKLLKAFKQDTYKNRYENFEELLEYCIYSANPVGRIMLELFGYNDDELFILSDKICTALQLTNFWQDVAVDIKKNRIYLPQEDLIKFNVTEDIISKCTYNQNFEELLKYNVNKTDELFSEGENLVNFLNGNFKKQIKFTIYGGKSIIKKIKKDYNVLLKRPKLSKLEYLYLFIKSSII